MTIEWTDKTTRVIKDSRIIQTALISPHGKEYPITFRTMNIHLPTQSVTQKDLDEAGIRESRIKTYSQVTPRILLGLDNAPLTAPKRTWTYRRLVVSETPFGLTLEGQTGTLPERTFVGLKVRVEEDLEKVVARFIDQDDYGLHPWRQPLESDENKRARTIMDEQARWVAQERRYEAPLLWRSNKHQMPDNRKYAEHRFYGFEKKMNKDHNLRESANLTINTYLRKGYIREVVATDRSPGWYLPTFAVSNERKTRLVWDAAAVFQGFSLNGQLLRGPDLNAPLWDIMLRFREWPVALCADISEMFHQVSIVKEDRPYQRFLWRWGPTDPLTTYEMQVMTFGANCSPYVAQYIKNRNANLFERDYPEAWNAIVNGHYVDDWIQSCRSETEALQLAKEVIQIQSRAGFTLHKWASNTPNIMRKLLAEGNDTKNLPTQTKALGVHWNTNADILHFDVSTLIQEMQSQIPTKREILRIVMSIYDPIGLISHVIIGGRLVLREIWKTKIGWDEKVPEEIATRWQKWIRSLDILSKLAIPRWCQVSDEKREIHVFVDASDSAMAAVAYIRGNGPGGTKAYIVASKCKVAPRKQATIPRLELQAAVLGVRLAEMVKKASSIPITSTTFWTDSEDVLWWINSAERKYHPFVAVRVSEIANVSNPHDWRRVPGKINPADLATKERQRIPEYINL